MPSPSVLSFSLFNNILAVNQPSKVGKLFARMLNRECHVPGFESSRNEGGQSSNYRCCALPDIEFAHHHPSNDIPRSELSPGTVLSVIITTGTMIARFTGIISIERNGPECIMSICIHVQRS